MSPNQRKSIILAAVSGFLSVLIGAFGAHVLKKYLSPEYLIVFETGVRYQFYHSLAAFCVSTINYPYKNRHHTVYLFLFGNILFSGSLYILAITEIKKFGMITPIGGVLYLCGWAHLIYAITRYGKENEVN